MRKRWILSALSGGQVAISSASFNATAAGLLAGSSVVPFCRARFSLSASLLARDLRIAFAQRLMSRRIFFFRSPMMLSNSRALSIRILPRCSSRCATQFSSPSAGSVRACAVKTSMSRTEPAALLTGATSFNKWRVVLCSSSMNALALASMRRVCVRSACTSLGSGSFGKCFNHLRSFCSGLCAFSTLIPMVYWDARACAGLGTKSQHPNLIEHHRAFRDKRSRLV